MTSNKHDKDREKPFKPCIAGDVAKANSCERGGGEVEGGEVSVHLKLSLNYIECDTEICYYFLAFGVWIALCLSTLLL